MFVGCSAVVWALFTCIHNLIFYKIVLIYRSIKDAVTQTSEILTYEADFQSIHKVDKEVSDELAYNIFNF